MCFPVKISNFSEELFRYDISNKCFCFSLIKFLFGRFIDVARDFRRGYLMLQLTQQGAYSFVALRAWLKSL